MEESGRWKRKKWEGTVVGEVRGRREEREKERGEVG